MKKGTEKRKGIRRPGPDRKRHMSLRTRTMWNKYLPIWLMMIPVFAFFFVFKVMPMYGIQMAFKDFNLMKGINKSPWVGLKHFKRLFADPYFKRIFRNTIKISLLSLCATIIRAHGGTIEAENNPAGGATFRFNLHTEEMTDEQQV